MLAGDEEGNTFGELGEGFGDHLYQGTKYVVLYPEDCIDGSEVEDFPFYSTLTLLASASGTIIKIIPTASWQ